MKNKKNIFLAALSGGLFVLCFPRFDLAWLAPGALVLMLAISYSAKPKAAFLYGWLSGTVFFAGLCYWVGIYGVLPWVVMAVTIGLVFGAVFSAISVIARAFPWWGRLLAVPAVWTLVELIRSETGAYSFSYGVIGYAFHGFKPALGLASVVGVYGISFIVAAFAAGIFETGLVVRSKKPRLVWIIAVTTILIALIPSGIGLALQRGVSNDTGTSVKVALVQASIPQNQKWLSSKSDQIMDKYEGLIKEASRKKPDLIILPEAALPSYVSEDDALVLRLKSWASEAGIPILAGVPLLKNGNAYNTAALIDGTGRQVGEYAKMTPVMFGEMIPFRAISERIYPDFKQMGDISTGNKQTILRIPGGTEPTFGTLICSESMYSRLAISLAKFNPDFITVITNDGWFYSSNEAEQHFAMTKFRAAETGRYIAQAANTGISAVISPAGVITGEIGLNESGASTTVVVTRPGGTIYTAGGWLATYAFIIIIAVAALVLGLVKVCTKPQEASIIQ